MRVRVLSSAWLQKTSGLAIFAAHIVAVVATFRAISSLRSRDWIGIEAIPGVAIGKSLLILCTSRQDSFPACHLPSAILLTGLAWQRQRTEHPKFDRAERGIRKTSGRLDFEMRLCLKVRTCKRLPFRNIPVQQEVCWVSTHWPGSAGG